MAVVDNAVKIFPARVKGTRVKIRLAQTAPALLHGRTVSISHADILRQLSRRCSCVSWVIFQDHQTGLQGQKASLTAFKLELKPVTRRSSLLLCGNAAPQQPGEYSWLKVQTLYFPASGGKKVASPFLRLNKRETRVLEKTSLGVTIRCDRSPVNTDVV